MLCELQKFVELCLRAKFLPTIALIFALAGYAGVAEGQSADLTGAEGRISGTVLTKADHRPAGQVAVRLKSPVAGIFRSLLTDAGSNGRCNTIWYKAVFKGGVYETRETIWAFG